MGFTRKFKPYENEHGMPAGVAPSMTRGFWYGKGGVKNRSPLTDDVVRGLVPANDNKDKGTGVVDV